ncbi:uncharacterized protein F4807DRAFT_469937 [Annulohypoxylon truncatum]|uniref:uncharacterized protein n=1 Tax=Annulohypoxylon truncatum TaxID=327061 RepID=UPI00200848CD|nr:uncharacterized protein F4807DRAFT_469937 [Annulohypoxylon truncatum]KAI1206722.1 hypothetical protein F4807DRAFT_469937 [Annulohypoxylon truncatum]
MASSFESQPVPAANQTSPNAWSTQPKGFMFIVGAVIIVNSIEDVLNGALEELDEKSADQPDDSQTPHIPPLNDNHSRAPIKSTAASPTSTARWTREETAVYMEHLASLTNEGLFDSDHWTIWRPAWFRLLDELNKFSPTKPWPIESMRMKRNNGADVSENGCSILSDQQWKRFIKQHPGAKWLRKTPRGNEKLYAQTFSIDISTGNYIRQAGEEGDLTLGSRQRSSPYGSDTPSRPKHKRHSQQYDPDLIDKISDDSDTDTDSAPPIKRKVIQQDLIRQAMTNRSVKRTNKALNTTELELAFDEHLRVMSRKPGSSDIEKAIRYLDEHLLDDMDDDQFIRACDA